MRHRIRVTALSTGILLAGATLLGASPAFALPVTVETFNDLQNAFRESAVGETTTIALGADITSTDLLNGHLTVPVEAGVGGAHVILDLNGHHLHIPKNTAQYAGIAVFEGATLTIQDLVGGGVLDVTSGDYAAGIGVSYSQWNDTYQPSNLLGGGTIIINSGTVNATGGDLGAGIGGAYYVGGGVITINGGDVTAIAGYEATGIGNGYYQESPAGAAGSTSISITGGTVTATGGAALYNTDGGGPGIGLSIGSSVSSVVDTIAISGCANVMATGGSGLINGGGAGIGAGVYNAAAPGVTIDGIAPSDAPAFAGAGAPYEDSVPGGQGSAIIYSGLATNQLSVSATTEETPGGGGVFSLTCTYVAPVLPPTAAPITTAVLASTGVTEAGTFGIAGFSVLLALLGIGLLGRAARGASRP
jgi:hypothetical protein